MLDSTLYVNFLLASLLFIVIPGPNVLLILATSLSGGPRSGLHVVAGTTLAMAAQLLIAAIATTVLVTELSDALEWVKWVGVVYLAYLGLQHLRITDVSAGKFPVYTAGGAQVFRRGFFVSLVNPKTIVFFGAFLPQFVSPAYPYIAQIAWLCLSFLVLALVVDSLYALGAGVVSQPLNERKFWIWRHRVIGTLFIGASFGLALFRRT